ncbi:SRPBCC family protein [Acinetobacter baumannii]|nr:SRPBCC family protein [Acinetobacter baumannii]TEX14866.1 SRPBCC family protein [Acinetobacter baumannii]TEX18695.1 SRPBCC family protein [Acinetobacter baumannii]TEX25341.1 SRPBCC family protein [Acinetobacter baumannii]
MLKTQKINIIQEFDAPIDKVFAALSEHENLSKLFAPAKVTRISNGKDARNGVGSARKMSIPFTPSFVETNLVYKENELIEYAITSGISPIKAHRGVMQFTDLGNNRTRLNYTISFKGRVPFIGPIIKAAFSVHDKFHRTLILSGFCLLKIAKISLNSSFFPKPIKR